MPDREGGSPKRFEAITGNSCEQHDSLAHACLPKSEHLSRDILVAFHADRPAFSPTDELKVREHLIKCASCREAGIDLVIEQNPGDLDLALCLLSEPLPREEIEKLLAEAKKQFPWLNSDKS